MRFGLLYEHQLPRPWTPGSEQRLISDALDQVELADRLGFDFVWEVEHHFLEEYSHSSASDVFLAAASQRTKDIRLGFGILPLPPGYQHPARVAETAAMLDLVSGGRVELGTGETSSGAELGGFGVDRETKRAQWDEALGVVARMMVEEPFAGHDGRFLSVPQRNVVPKPVQKPHPPLWVACSRRETIRLAAEKGIGALSFSFVEPEEAKEWVDEYHAIIASERCVPAGFAVNPSFAVALPMMVHGDEAQAIERGIDGAHFFGYALAHYYVFGDHHPGRTDIHAEFERRRAEVGFAREVVTPGGQAPLGIKILEQGLGSLRGAIGTPEQVRDLVARYEAAGVDQLIFVMQAGTNRHEHICEALELFAAEVMPEFHARAATAEEAKLVRMRPAMDQALARRESPRIADPHYTVHPMDSGPPAEGGGGSGRDAPAAGGGPAANGGAPAPRLRRRSVAMRRAAEVRGEQAFRTIVRRSGDRGLERTFGSDAGLRIIFRAMAQAYVPEKAGGFEGDIVYSLRTIEGVIKPWTVNVGPQRARARPGHSEHTRLTVKIGVADFLRLAARELDPGRALIGGKLDLEGDFAIAARLGEMFGQPSPY